MNGTVHTSTVNLGIIPASWSIVGSGDFNGDRKPDILWQHSSGSRAIWLMNGTVRSASISLGLVSTSWNIVGRVISTATVKLIFFGNTPRAHAPFG